MIIINTPSFILKTIYKGYCYTSVRMIKKAFALSLLLALVLLVSCGNADKARYVIGVLFASYIYPTRGDEVLRLAMNILEGKPFARENQLSSALIDADNAHVLLMQNDETVRQRDHLTTLRSRVDKAADDVHVQQTYLLVLLVVIVLLVVVCAYAVRGYFLKASMNRQLKKSDVERDEIYAHGRTHHHHP